MHPNNYLLFSEAERERALAKEMRVLAKEMSIAFLKISATLLVFKCLIYSQNFSLVEGRMTDKNNPTGFSG